MKKNQHYLLLLLLFLLSCSNKNQLSITGTGFGDEIELQQNLSFKFSHDIVNDSLVDKWDSTSLIKFSPEVKGLFRWQSRNELIFSPTGSFKPATGYKTTLQASLLKLFRKGLTLQTEGPSFHTADLKVTGDASWWTLSGTSSGMLQLNTSLFFNYNVSGNALRSFIKVQLNGKETDFTIASEGASQELVIKVDGISRENAASCKLAITINNGATCVDCSNSINKPIVWNGNVSSPENLVVTALTPQFDSDEGQIEVQCNQPVDVNEINQFVTVAPAVGFTIEATQSGFIIKGPFATGASYNVTLKKGIKGLIGGELTENYVQDVSFGQSEPSLGFTNKKGFYLSSRSSKKIGIMINNIPKVEVTLFKVYENNIIHFMRTNRYSDYYDEGGSSDYNYSFYDLERYGNEVLKKEYDTKNLPRKNGQYYLDLDFTDNLPFNGVYLVHVRSTEDQWIQDISLVSISDIGIITKKGQDDLMVFVNSIKDATPSSNVKVTVTSTNNQVLFTGTTDAMGAVRFAGLSSRFPEFEPGMISVKNGADYNFLLLNDTRVETSRFETGGMRDNPSGVFAYLYGDREIYRPGDSIYINTIIRKNDLTVQSETPVKIKVVMPNGREFATFRKNADKQGAAETRFKVPVSAVTGTWIVEAYTFNDVMIGNKQISIEEFIPDRISVKTEAVKDIYTLKDSLLFKASAVNLFGPPAAGRNYQADLSINKKAFYVKGFEDYDFSLSGTDNTSFPGVLREGKTDAQGNLKETFSFNREWNNTGLLNGKVFLTVFDETGRPVNRVATFNIATQNIFHGIKLSDHYNTVGQALQVGLIALNPEGKKVSSQTVLKFIKVEYHTVLERGYDDNYHYRSQRSERVLSEKAVTIGQNGLTLPFTPVESGEYLVRIYNEGSDRYVESEFYAWRWGSSTASSFAVNTEGQIDITTDKEIYNPGDKAKLLFKTPFAGRLLITLERNSVIDYFYVETDKRSAEIEIPVKEEYLPNIYVTATLFRPLDEGTIPLTAGHGIIPVNIEKASNKLPLSISAVSQSKSKSRQTIKIKSAPGTPVEVTVAVVDEGIMQLKNSKTPDPYNYFYQKRALTVDGYDVYPFLLPDVTMKSSSMAGDGYDLSKRVNPLTNKRVKLVAFWSGILKTNAAGEASYTVNIPQFSGDLRVMAAAWRDQSFGSAEHHIKVADPVVISTSMPRFLSPGDTLNIPVTLTNTTAADMNMTASLSSSGGIRITGNSNFTKSLEKNAETQVMFRAIAGADPGEASVTVNVNAGNENYSDKTDITIRPAASLQKIFTSGEIKANSEQIIDLSTQFIPSSVDAEIFISNSPVARFKDQLSYLLDYPHGCVEQITSIAFPQLYYPDLISAIKNNPSYPVNARDNVNAAIRKLESMQLYNGSLSYWPGGNMESWWGTIYATHFMMEAQKLGYEVNKNVMKKSVRYIEKKVKERPVEKLIYYDATGHRLERTIPAKDIFYSLYILALNGESDLSSMNYYKNRFSELSIDSKYLLAVTYLACGDRKSYDLLLPKQFEGEKSENSFGGNFYSYIRDESLAMNALITVDPENVQLIQMARRISNNLQTEKYLNTQERSFAFLALGKYLSKRPPSDITAEITDAKGRKYDFKGKDLNLRNIAPGKVIVRTSGTGALYYSSSVEGLTRDGSFKEEDSNLMIRRSYLDRTGKALNRSALRQNDLIVVRISLQNLSRNTVENIVITDMLPAGFEIENPRVGAVAELDWIKDATEPDYLDMRDDRINLYTNIGYKQQNYYYLVRAVSTGNFVAGPVSADAMYNGEYHSYNGAGRVIINAR